MAVSCSEKMQNEFKWGHVGSRDPICNFGTPLKSRELLQLETSNLAWRRTAVSSKDNAKLGLMGHVGSRYPLLEFWYPPNISRTVEAINFKFGTETDGSEF